ncbi:hypothetical protein DUNSADRAFT_12732 [Dunaliella salina]|uniref:Secreted protein n=1 Tax=Dunaliella salina TaxID=3046 RepID=A0ABQ7GAP5_DUNSA|nr:hypothetical protein DUNSADRAFT_12732 [Dunaliella salina]|eukprot:KAF5831678.1 hypothetical protein DUNSADRAFT_12732 [Dunaliella salina]
MTTVLVFASLFFGAASTCSRAEQNHKTFIFVGQHKFVFVLFISLSQLLFSISQCFHKSILIASIALA